MKKSLFIVGLLLLTTTVVNAQNWFLYETKTCKMSFPGKPESQQQTVNSAVGELKLDINMYEVPDSVKDDNLVYGLIESAYPDSTINSDKKDILDNFFRNAIDGAVKNVHGKLLSETIIDFEGYPGREIKVDFKDGLAVIKMRFYLIKNKVYALQTITLTQNDFNVSINKFLNSFALIK